MRILLPLLATLVLVGLPVLAHAHTGGTLDADGCHEDHRTGAYHCHRGPAAGYTFANRATMEEALKTGNFPDPKTVAAESFASKLWPFSKKADVGEPDLPGTAAAAAGSTAVQPNETEQRLKILQGLVEMGLISKEEYEAKRKAILDGI